MEDLNITELLWSIGVKWSVGVKSFHTYAPFHTYVSLGMKNPKKIFHRRGGESNPGLRRGRRESLPLYHGSCRKKMIFILLFVSITLFSSPKCGFLSILYYVWYEFYQKSHINNWQLTIVPFKLSALKNLFDHLEFRQKRTFGTLCMYYNGP